MSVGAVVRVWTTSEALVIGWPRTSETASRTLLTESSDRVAIEGIRTFGDAAVGGVVIEESSIASLSLDTVRRCCCAGLAGQRALFTKIKRQRTDKLSFWTSFGANGFVDNFVESGVGNISKVIASLTVIECLASASCTPFVAELALLGRCVFIVASRTVLDANTVVQVDIEAICEEATCAILR